MTLAERQDNEVIVPGVWSEWRCPYCGKLLSKYVLPLGGIVETKCWGCKTLLRLELPMHPPDEDRQE